MARPQHGFPSSFVSNPSTSSSSTAGPGNIQKKIHRSEKKGGPACVLCFRFPWPRVFFSFFCSTVQVFFRTDSKSVSQSVLAYIVSSVVLLLAAQLQKYMVRPRSRFWFFLLYDTLFPSHWHSALRETCASFRHCVTDLPACVYVL